MKRFILFYREASDKSGERSRMTLEIPDVDYITPQELHEAPQEKIDERHEITSHNAALIACDNFRQIFANEKLLSRHVPQEIDGFHYWVEPSPPEKAPAEPWYSRLKRRFMGRRCGKCAYFDHEEGLKWRHQETTVYEDGSTTKMWDDVLKMSAEQHDLVAITDKNIGYCPRLERIVHAASAQQLTVRAKAPAAPFHPSTTM